jgi:chromosome segregation ATPase
LDWNARVLPQVKSTSAWQNKKETYEADIEACNTDTAAISDMKQSLVDKQLEHTAAHETCTQKQAAAAQSKEDSEEMQAKFLKGELSADGDSSTGSLADQLEAAKAHVNSVETSAKQLETKIKHMRKELETKQKEQGKGAKEHEKLTAEKQKLQAELNKIKLSLLELDYNEEHEQELLANKAKAEQVMGCRQPHKRDSHTNAQMQHYGLGAR